MSQSQEQMSTQQQQQQQQQQDSTKRQAMTGQWRTPPVPQFAAGTQHPQQQRQQQQPQSVTSAPHPGAASSTTASQQSTNNQTQQQPQVSFIPTNLPTSSDDYAIALQEAYRRGAEAAMTYGGGTTPTVPMPTAVSCPNFDELRPESSSPISYPLGEEPDPQQHQQQQQSQHPFHHHSHHHQGGAPAPAANVPNPLDSSATVPNPLVASSSNPPSTHAPPPTQHHHHQQPQQQQQQQHHHHHQPPVGAPLQQPPQQQHQPHHPSAPSQQQHQVHHVSHAPAPAPPQQQQQQVRPTTSSAAPASRITHVSSAGTATAAIGSSSGRGAAGLSPPPNSAAAAAGPRSLSLPDMASYAARAQAEEEKRKKRLARNRASARLRRLRKKNLVDSYEGEVGVLESSLQKLKAHEWGEPHNTNEAVLEALSMERGQQTIDDDQRSSLIKEILKQQRDQVSWIKEVQTELSTLQWYASVSAEGGGGGGGAVDHEEAELIHELNQILNLSNDQKSSIIQATDGMEKEVEAVETVDECLKAMEENDFLLNEGVTDITKQFMSILHPNQISKFLLWTDSNSEQLEQMDYVYAPPKDAPLPSGPVYTFGMEGDYQGEGSGKDDGGAS